MERLIRIGIIITVAFVLVGVLFFFQTKDPMLLLMATQLALPAWGILLIIHVLRHGIPIRIVADERRLAPPEDEAKRT